jgi:ribosomal protein S18 acetylase RimI-like enzyme
MEKTNEKQTCGTLAISPDYRGSGISQKLFELHKTEAKKHGCKQLFLEVIVGNERAIHFYKKMGYEKIFDIVYFSNDDLSKLKSVSKNIEFEIKNIDLAVFKKRIHQ